MKNVVGICIVLIAFGAGSGCIRTKQGYLSKGNKLYEEGKFEDAAINYRKAIQRDPNFGEAHYRLGLAEIKLKHSKEAYSELFRAVQLLPGNMAAREKFADVCLGFYLGDPNRPKVLYDQLTQLSSEILAANANSYEGMIVKAYLYETDRNPKEAIALFRKALETNSSDAGVGTEVVRLLLQDGQIQDAEKLATEMIERQKTSSSQIYDLMYSYYYNANRIPDAERILKIRVRNNPKHGGYILQLARHYARVNKPEEMKGTLHLLLDNPKDFPEARLWVGNFYMLIQNYPEALQNYEAGAGAHSNPKERVAYQDKIMLTWLAQGKTEEATRVAAEILKQDPENDNALRLEGDDLLNNGKPDKVEAALKIFQGLSARHPEDPVLHFHLGRAYKGRGDLDSARTQFNEAIKRRGDFLRPRYELVELDLVQHPDRALQETNQILTINPADPRGKLLHVRCLMARGDFTAAQSELRGLLNASPQDKDALVQMGLLALKRNGYKEAADIFEKVRGMGEPQGVLGLATTYSSQRQTERAISVLQDGLKKWPDSIPILAQLASTEALAGSSDQAILHFQKLLAAEPSSAQWRFRLGEVYDVKGDLKKAIEYYQQASDAAPSEPALAITVADALSRYGRIQEARKRYEGILKAHPDNATALNNLAYLLADQGTDLDEALKFANQALSKAPTEPSYSDTVGYVYLKKGQRDSAAQTFLALTRKYPKDRNIAVFRYHLGMALFEKGDKAGARKELLAALAAHPAPQDEARIKELLSRT